MAVSGTDTKVQGQERANFGTTMNSSAYVQAVGANEVVHHDTALFDGHLGSWDETVNPYDGEVGEIAVLGIKNNFQNEMNKAIATYTGAEEGGLMYFINQLETDTATIIANGFKGTQVETAISNLIVALKAETKSFTDALSTAEDAIVAEVAKAYQDQDTDLAKSIEADTSKMGAAPTN